MDEDVFCYVNTVVLRIMRNTVGLQCFCPVYVEVRSKCEVVLQKRWTLQMYDGVSLFLGGIRENVLTTPQFSLFQLKVDAPCCKKSICREISLVS